MTDSNKRTRLEQSTNSIPHSQEISFLPPIRTSNTSVITVQSTSPQSMEHHHHHHYEQQRYNSEEEEQSQEREYLEREPHMEQTTEMSLIRGDVNNVNRSAYENEQSNSMQETFNEIPASVETTVPVDAALEEELDRWGLDEELKTNLRAMTPNTRREIINDIVREQQILHASQYVQSNNNNNINIFDRRSNINVNSNNYYNNNNNSNEEHMSDNFMSSDEPEFIFDLVNTIYSRGNGMSTLDSNDNNYSGDEEGTYDNQNNDNNDGSISIDSEVEEHDVNSQIDSDEGVIEMTRNNDNNEEDDEPEEHRSRLLPIIDNNDTNHNDNGIFLFNQSVPSHRESNRESRRRRPRRAVMWRRVNPNDGQVPLTSSSRWSSETGTEINSSDSNREQERNSLSNNPAMLLSHLLSGGYSGRSAGLQNIFTMLAESLAQNNYGLLERDVDDMTYEELLELEERIGKVNKGLTPEQIQAVLCEVRHLPRNERCVICLEDFIPEISSTAPTSDVNTVSSTHHTAKSRNSKKSTKEQKATSTLTQRTSAKHTHKNDTNNSNTLSDNYSSVKTTNDNNNNSSQDNDCDVNIHVEQTSLQSSSINEKCVQIISCGHVFHKQCIEQWLRHNKTCPVCNQEIPIYKQGNN